MRKFARFNDDVPGLAGNVLADFQRDGGCVVASGLQGRNRGIVRTTTQARNFAPVLIFGQSRNGFHRSVDRSEEHTSELQSLMRISYAVFCLKKKKYNSIPNNRACKTRKK